MSIIEASYIDRLCGKKRKVYESKTGTGIVPVYEYQIIDGVKTLVKSGEHNLQEEIDSFAESTLIQNLLERFANGDTSVMRTDGIYGDFSDVPTSYAEVFKRVQQCENLFNSLPADLRSKFDNSYQKFWSDFGTDNFNSIMDEFNNSVPESVEQKVEVTENAE